MAIFRLLRIPVKDQQGQSTVEYILLYAVVISLVSLVFNSDAFQNTFGENGQFATFFKRQIEYSYRHGLPGEEAFRRPDYRSDEHDTYRRRFFIGDGDYPQN